MANPDIIVTRFKQQKASDTGQTLGNLYIPDPSDADKTIFDCRTLELPWRKNLRNISCIPPKPGESATYKWIMVNDTPSFPYAHLWIKQVPDRTNIAIHSGNFIVEEGEESKGDSRGCPIIGESFEYINDDGLLDVTNSRDTMAEMCRILKEEVGKTEGSIMFINNIGRY